MLCSKTLVMVAVMTVAPASSEYRTHETSGENNHEEDERSTVDYRKYFGGFGDKISRTSSDQTSERTLGFYPPLGLIDFFQDGPFGMNGMAGGTYRGFGGTSNNVSSSLGQKIPSNGSGSVENIKFDASTSASDSDLRPREFPPSLRSEFPPSSTGSFSPSFAMLKQDVDEEVSYQKKEGSLGDERADDREISSEENKSIKLDGFDFSRFNFDISREQGSTEKSSEEHQRRENNRDDSNENTSSELITISPYSIVNHHHRPSSYRSASKDKVPKHPSTRSHILRDDVNAQQYSPSLSKRKPGLFEEVSKYYVAAKSPPNADFSPHSNLRYRPLVYNSPSNLNGYSPAYYPSGRSNIHYVPHLYRPVLPKSGGVPHISRNLNLHYRPKPLFKPSSIDVYHEYDLNSPYAKRRAHPTPSIPRQDVWRSHPHVDRFTEVTKKVNPPAVSAYKQKKFCKKSRKKIGSREFPRYEQQKMICYTCSDKAKNSTYEECRYEPEDGSFYEKVAETRSFKTVFPSSLVGGRYERSVGKSNEKTEKSSPKQSWLLNRNKREYDDDDDSEEQIQDEDSLEFFADQSSSEERDEWLGGDVPSEDDYSFEGNNDSDESSSIEREYQPPKTSTDGSCHEVIKKGHTCLVCKNSKTGSASEQCSYSSDPDDKKYEYSRQSSYGSRRNPGVDRYKRFDTIDRKKELLTKHQTKYLKTTNKNGVK